MMFFVTNVTNEVGIIFRRQNARTNNTKNLIKRVEILGEAAQTALEAILEIQAEQKLLTYLLLEKEPADEN